MASLGSTCRNVMLMLFIDPPAERLGLRASGTCRSRYGHVTVARTMQPPSTPPDWPYYGHLHCSCVRAAVVPADPMPCARRGPAAPLAHLTGRKLVQNSFFLLDEARI